MTNTQKIIAAVVAVAAIVVVVVKASGNDPEPTKPDAAAPEVVATTPPPIVTAPPAPSPAPSDVPTAAGTSISMATAAYEAKMVSRAQASLDRGDYKKALQEIEDYEKIPDRALLTPEATMIKITALSHVGRRTDALAIAMETRDDEKYKDYHEKIEDILIDAGLRQP